MGAAAEMDAQVRAALSRCGAVREGTRMVVAVSGGADSVGLLASLNRLRRNGAFGGALAVAHVRHHLRGAESDAEAEFVMGLARRFELPGFCFDAAVDPGAPNLEARAREARIAGLRGLAGAWRARFLLLAHTREDQAETFLMRLARGGGVSSLAAMEEARADGVLRPLLGVARADVRESLRADDIEWCEDSSNASDAFFRNRIRNALLPVLDDVLGVDTAERLARLAAELRVESDLAEREVRGLLAGHRAELPLEVLEPLGPAAGRVVHAWLRENGVRATERQIVQVLRIARRAQPSGHVDLAAGAAVRRRYASLFFMPPSMPREGPGLWGPLVLPPGGAVDLPNGMELVASSEGCSSSFGEALAVPEDSALAARAPRPGDRVRLAAGRRKLGDLLIQRKVPRDLRPWLTVVVQDADIVWVPGVYRSTPPPGGPNRSGSVIGARHWLLESLPGC